MCKGTKGKPLSQKLKTINKFLSQYRYVVEHTFGSIKRWFSGATALSIAYNLYRAKKLHQKKISG